MMPTLGGAIAIGASATTGGSSGTVEEAAGGTVGSAVATTGGSAFVGWAAASFLESFCLASLSASEKLFFCFLLGKHMGRNGREREFPLADMTNLCLVAYGFLIVR